MKVFVVGASGRVGQELVSRLVDRGAEVMAGCRTPGAITAAENVTPVEFDVHWDVPRMTAALEGCDAVHFVAGSRGKDLLQTDAFGAVKLMQAAEAAGIKRFILLSSIYALQPERWAEEASLASITNYNIAKFFADSWLTKNTDLDWTIVQPSVLKEEPGTGKIELDPQHDGANPIPDVAEVLAATLDQPNTIGKVILMKSGDEPIAEALARV